MCENRKAHNELCQQILDTKMNDYCEKTNKSILVRSWEDKTEALLSDTYGIFDDTEMLDILENVPYFTERSIIWYRNDASHTHIRFIDNEELNVSEDSSPLSLAIFVDNSMVGKGSLSVKFGVYRHACTNGMIWGLHSLTIVRQIHKSGKDFSDILLSALADTDNIKEILTKNIKGMINTESSINGLDEDKAVDYLRVKLAVSTKFAKSIIESYTEKYGKFGNSKYALVNAITDKAHDLSLDSRLRLERIALKVA
jgi:hypothetical protein